MSAHSVEKNATGFTSTSGAESIISNMDFLLYFFKLIQLSGQQSLDLPTVKNAMNIEKTPTKVLQIYGVKNPATALTPIKNKPILEDIEVNRWSYRIQNSRQDRIWFEANDIEIVGGTAILIYDYALNSFKKRKSINDLEKFVKKKTADIDIVWWPRTDERDGFVIVSESKAIETLSHKFKEVLETQLTEKLSTIQEYVKNLTSVNVSEPTHIKPAGVYTINILFKIKDVDVKICDISIHDGASSQRIFDVNTNKPIMKMEQAGFDPMYSVPIPSYKNSLNHLFIQTAKNEGFITVPSIQSLIEQQVLAFGNFLKQNNPKSLVNYNRLKYIKKLLSSIDVSNKNNQKNVSEVFKSIGDIIPKQNVKEVIAQTLVSLNEDVDTIIKKYKDNLTEICSKSKNDALCKEHYPSTNSLKQMQLPIEPRVIYSPYTYSYPSQPHPHAYSPYTYSYPSQPHPHAYSPYTYSYPSYPSHVMNYQPVYPIDYQYDRKSGGNTTQMRSRRSHTRKLSKK